MELITENREGDGVDIDHVEVASLMRLASEMGDDQVASSMGYMLITGEGSRAILKRSRLSWGGG